HLSGPMDWYDALERLEGWRDALRESGMEPGPILNGDWSADSGYGEGLALDPETGVTAIFAANDQMALGLIRALHEQQLEIPRNLSVVGYDDQPEAAHFYPPLTTIRQDFEEVGRQCIAALLESLQPGKTDGRRVLEPLLVV